MALQDSHPLHCTRRTEPIKAGATPHNRAAVLHLPPQQHACSTLVALLHRRPTVMQWPISSRLLLLLASLHSSSPLVVIQGGSTNSLLLLLLLLTPGDRNWATCLPLIAALPLHTRTLYREQGVVVEAPLSGTGAAVVQTLKLWPTSYSHFSTAVTVYILS